MTILSQSAADTIVAKTATVATYGGSVSAILGGINANWVAAIGGILVGIAGLWMNWHFKSQHLKLMRERVVIGYDDE